VKEYDIFLPLRYNDGSPIELIKFVQLHERLLSEFSGLTYFPQPNQGFWKLGDVTYRDEIVIFRVLATDSRRARRFLRKLKEELKAELLQEEILIVERDVNSL
jgi:hypothetical protein